MLKLNNSKHHFEFLIFFWLFLMDYNFSLNPLCTEQFYYEVSKFQSSELVLYFLETKNTPWTRTRQYNIHLSNSKANSLICDSLCMYLWDYCRYYVPFPFSIQVANVHYIIRRMLIFYCQYTLIIVYLYWNLGLQNCSANISETI